MIKFLWINSINPLSEVETRYPNLGIGYLAAALKRAYGEDFFEFRMVVDKIPEELETFRPDLVGISSVSQNYGIAIRHASEAKKRGVPVIIGGVHISFLPDSLTPEMDVGCLGEAEEVIVDLLKIFIEHKGFPATSLKDLSGVVYRDGSGRISVTSRRRPIMPLDNIPYPDRKLISTKSHTYLFTSRGCPYRCCFCASSRYWDALRFFSAERVVTEIEYLVNRRGVKFISFFDDLFIADKKRFFRIIELLEQKEIVGKVKFSCSVRANTVTREIAVGLKRMGVVSVGMGLESGNQRVLAWLKGDGITVEQNRQAVRLLREQGIFPNASFVIGAPDETEKEVLDTLNFIKKEPLGLFDVYVLTPFPGTPVWDLAKGKGLVSEGREMDWGRLNVNFEVAPDKAIILSESLPRSDIIKLYSKFRRYRLYHNMKSVWRHPMITDIPRYAIKFACEWMSRKLH